MTNNANVIIGKRIRMYRERLGMSQEELAIHVGFQSRSAIYHIEKGERDIYTPLIPVIANALHVSINDLLGEPHDIDPYKEFYMFLPYLAKAEEWQLQAVRELLKMPIKKVSDSNYIKQAN